MESIGSKMNLKQHMGGNPAKLVWASIDTEGHKGRDGRYYIIGNASQLPINKLLICCFIKIVQEFSRLQLPRKERGPRISINCFGPN